jgi:hypothetical protein
VKAKTIGIQRDVTLIVTLMGAAGLLAASAVPVSADTLFNQTNLVSDIPGLAMAFRHSTRFRALRRPSRLLRLS